MISHGFINSQERRQRAAAVQDAARGTMVVENAERPGVLQSSGALAVDLADRQVSPTDYGESFSRCGWWSRFQRDKAASLVSAKRNGSVGDSTWPSQKTTLALP